MHTLNVYIYTERDKQHQNAITATKSKGSPSLADTNTKKGAGCDTQRISLTLVFANDSTTGVARFFLPSDPLPGDGGERGRYSYFHGIHHQIKRQISDLNLD